MSIDVRTVEAEQFAKNLLNDEIPVAAPYINLVLPELLRIEQLAHDQLSKALIDVLADPHVDLENLPALTGQTVKAKALGKAFSKFAAAQVWVRSQPIPDYIEGHHPSAAVVSLQKARHGRDYLQSQDIENDTYAGADGNFFIRNVTDAMGHQKRDVPAEGFVWQTKLDRLGRKLTEPEFEREYMRQYDLLVNQQRLLLCWDIAYSIVNGHESTAQMYVYADATPFTPEELSTYLEESVMNGKFYSTNTRGKLIEWLVNKGHLKRLAFVPPQYFQEHGRNAPIEPWMQAVTPDLARLAVGMIFRTTPTVLGTMHK